MAATVKTRTVTSKAFRRANEVDPSELPGKLDILQKYVLDAVEYDCRNFAMQIAIWKDNNLYQHFDATWEDFVANRIKQPIEWIENILHGLSFLDCSKPQKASDAIAASKSASANLAKQLGETPTRTVKPKGGNYNPEGKNQYTRPDHGLNDYNHLDLSLVAEYGDSPEYLAARIARDNPDIQEKMKQGEYPSVRAAAVDAGIVKPRVQVTWKAEATPEEIAQAVIKKIPDGLEEDVIKAMMQMIL